MHHKEITKGKGCPARAAPDADRPRSRQTTDHVHQLGLRRMLRGRQA